MSCRGCEKRHIGCHAECEEYMESWRKNREADRQRELETESLGMQIRGAERRQRIGPRERKWK